MNKDQVKGRIEEVKGIRAQLDLPGYAADIANDGKLAFESWKTGDYALVLTDVHMPRIDGHQLTSEIRAQDAVFGSPRTPVIVLTTLKGKAEKCSRVGMAGYLSKPAQLTEHSVVLNRWPPTVPGSNNKYLGNGNAVVTRADFRQK